MGKCDIDIWTIQIRIEIEYTICFFQFIKNYFNFKGISYTNILGYTYILLNVLPTIVKLIAETVDLRSLSFSSINILI